jgi:membrane protein
MRKKIFHLARAIWYDLTTKRVMNDASMLTYSTLLAIVPILAVVFAIARGFGFSKYIESWFRDTLSSQPQAAETIIGFVNSYLIHTKSGIFLGFGLIFMLWTVIMLTRNIERTFNNIWQVKKGRSFFRTITDYLAMFFLIPIIIVITSGISIFMATISNNIHEYVVIGSAMNFAIIIMPYILMSAIFTALYVFMPNTKVKIRSAILPGIGAGVLMQILQVFYIHSQIWVSSYNAIYGSFAALPLFMLWIQISWTICLLGAELSYTSQNLGGWVFNVKTDILSHRYKLMLCAILMSLICKRFKDGMNPYTALDLKKKTNIPIRIVNELLYQLESVHLLSEVMHDDKGDEIYFQPALSLSNLSVGVMVDRLESLGEWNLDINLREFTSVNWGRAYNLHSEYLKELRNILLIDL